MEGLWSHVSWGAKRPSVSEELMETYPSPAAGASGTPSPSSVALRFAKIVVFTLLGIAFAIAGFALLLDA